MCSQSPWSKDQGFFVVMNSKETADIEFCGIWSKVSEVLELVLFAVYLTYTCV